MAHDPQRGVTERLERACALDAELRREIEIVMRVLDDCARTEFLAAFARELERVGWPAQALVPALNAAVWGPEA